MTRTILLGAALIAIATVNAQTLHPGWPQPNGAVYAIAKDAATGQVYIGGDFTEVDGMPHEHVARFNEDGSLDTWAPSVNGLVRAIAFAGNSVYVGGEFSAAGGETRNLLAALDATSGDVLPWDPDASLAFNGVDIIPSVDALLVDGNTVYATGNFTGMGADERLRIAALDGTTGQATAWAPSIERHGYALVSSGDTLFVGYTSMGPTVSAFNMATGELFWEGGPNYQDGNFPGISRALVKAGNVLYACGRFNLGGTNGFAAINAATGLLNTWTPDPGWLGNSLALNANTLYVGGNTLGALDIPSEQVTGWQPMPDGGVNALLLDGNTIYAGGYFTTISGEPQAHFAALDAGCLGFPCDDGDACTINDVLDSDCQCAGTPTPLTASLTSNMPRCQGSDIYIYGHVDGANDSTSYAWTGPNGFDLTYEYDFLYLAGADSAWANGTWTLVASNGGCSSNLASIDILITPDSDGDGVCDGVDNCPSLPGQQGDPCDDGDADTQDDVITSDCACLGTSGPCVPPADLVVSNSGPVCSESVVELGVIASGTGPLEYAWTGPAINGDPTLPNVTADIGFAGEFVFQVVVSNACGTATGETTVSATTLQTGLFDYQEGVFANWCADTLIDVQHTVFWTPGGSFSGLPGVVVDPASGQVDGPLSTPGTYIITYSLEANGPCPAYQTVASITLLAPSVWYADADNDGAGDANTSTTSCEQPPGTVLNADDLCPDDGAKTEPGTCGCGNPEPGTPCDDGNENTINDVITTDCVCLGEPSTGIISSTAPATSVRYDRLNGTILVQDMERGPVVLIDATGQLVQSAFGQVVRFNTGSLPDGLYVVRSAHLAERVVVVH